MIDYEYILLKKLSSSGKENYMERYIHCLGVANTAVMLNQLFNLNLDQDKTYLAGLLHDYAKFTTLDEYKNILNKYGLDESILSINKNVWHGLIGVYIVKEELGIIDEDILNAITYHITGRPNMSDLEKIIYISDIVEPNRVGEYYDMIRNEVFESKDINKSIAFISQNIIDYLQKKTYNIFDLTYKTYEFYKKYI